MLRHVRQAPSRCSGLALELGLLYLQGNPTTSLALMLEASSGVAGETLEPLVLHVRETQPLELSMQQVQRMTWQELVRLWKVRLLTMHSDLGTLWRTNLSYAPQLLADALMPPQHMGLYSISRHSGNSSEQTCCLILAPSCGLSLRGMGLTCHSGGRDGQIMQGCVLQEYVNGLAMALVGLGSASDSPSPRLTVCFCF